MKFNVFLPRESTSCFRSGFSQTILVHQGQGQTSVHSAAFLKEILANFHKRRNGILLTKLFWPTVRKNCFSDWEKFWNSRLKAKNLQNVWDH